MSASSEDSLSDTVVDGEPAIRLTSPSGKQHCVECKRKIRHDGIEFQVVKHDKVQLYGPYHLDCAPGEPCLACGDIVRDDDGGRTYFTSSKHGASRTGGPFHAGCVPPSCPDFDVDSSGGDGDGDFLLPPSPPPQSPQQQPQQQHRRRRLSKKQKKPKETKRAPAASYPASAVSKRTRDSKADAAMTLAIAHNLASTIMLTIAGDGNPLANVRSKARWVREHVARCHSRLSGTASASSSATATTTTPKKKKKKNEHAGRRPAHARSHEPPLANANARQQQQQQEQWQWQRPSRPCGHIKCNKRLRHGDKVYEAYFGAADQPAYVCCSENCALFAGLEEHGKCSQPVILDATLGRDT
jgi:hypothetical protein